MTSTAGVESRFVRFAAGWWLPLGWLVLAATYRSGIVYEGDPYWQARAGMENLAGQPLVRPDSWSWSPLPQDWVQHSPGWNTALGLSWRALGSWGMFGLTTLYLALVLVLLLVIARRLGVRPIPFTIAALAGVSGAIGALSPRAALWSFALLVAALAVSWIRFDALRRAPLAVASMEGMITAFAFAWIGVWLHSSWAFLAVVSTVSVAALWFAAGMPIARVAVLGVAATGAALLGVVAGPYGTGAWRRALAVGRDLDGLITEWAGSFVSSNLSTYGVLAALELVVLMALGAMLAHRNPWTHRGRMDRAAWAFVTVLTMQAAGLVVMGIQMSRFAVGAAYMLVIPLAWALSEAPLPAALQGSRAMSEAIRARLNDRYGATVLALVLLVLSPSLVPALLRHSEAAGVTSLEALPAGCRLFGDEAASTAILYRPDVTVWSDGRADYWGRERLQAVLDYYLVADPAELVPPGTTCVALIRGSSQQWLPLAAALDASPQWQRVATQDDRRLWVLRTGD